MIQDHNKNITHITYNHLNLPKKISFQNNNYIEYTYDASGVKLRKKVKENNTVSVTDYLDGFQYNNSKLQFFPHAEGYVKHTLVGDNNDISIFKYVFQYKDHLGNIQVNYTLAKGSLVILDEHHYYPFGLEHGAYNPTRKEYRKAEDGGNNDIVIITEVENSGYQYKYNGKELQDELGLNWYDYGARNYMPDIGRMPTIDPLAEIMESDTPYGYAFNNPVFYVDSNGAIPWPVHSFFNQFSRRIASWYGPRTCTGCSSFHRGLDINFGSGFDDYGAPVLATHPGKIVSIKTTLSGAGRNIVIQSPGGTLQTLYFHLSRVDVIQGQNVGEGQIIGAIGASGRGKEKGYPSHLHYAIKMNNGAGQYNWYNPTEGRGNSNDNIIDPMFYINIIGPRTQEYYNNQLDNYNVLFDPIYFAPTPPTPDPKSNVTPLPVTPSPPTPIPTPTPTPTPIPPSPPKPPKPLPVTPPKPPFPS